VEALGGVDLETVRREPISLMDPSGLGKITLLELLDNIGEEGGPSAGEILIEEKTPQELKRSKRYGLVSCL
jgi:ABC-type nitrate/sulfonate/bicarbonate transport system ATPase subunit